MDLILVALAPVAIILIYVYVRDRYEKEPIHLLLKALFAGVLVTAPIILLESFLGIFYSGASQVLAAFYKAFVVAAFSEESFKFLALFLLIWRSKEFDERFDGIVYAVFISLGFAAAENILYVFEYGKTIGLLRAFTAVPAHAIFGVIMGYYFSLAKFESQKTQLNLFKALAVPILFHGFYDFILMVNHPLYLFAFLPFLTYMWIFGFKKMKALTTKPNKLFGNQASFTKNQ